MTEKEEKELADRIDKAVRKQLIQTCTWQRIRGDAWVFGEMIRGTVRIARAEIYFDDDPKQGGWVWFVHDGENYGHGKVIKTRGKAPTRAAAITYCEEALGIVPPQPQTDPQKPIMIHKIHLLCDMLIDQNRYIGDDAIGHRCSNNAVVELSARHPRFPGALVCHSCLNLIKTAPERLSLPLPYGRKYQIRLLDAFAKNMLDTNKGSV